MHSSSGLGFSLCPITVRGATHSVPVARILSILMLGALTSLVACRDARAAGSCEQYPISWQPPSDSAAAAREDLASLSPDATMTWNQGTGTLSEASQLATSLSGCTDGQDVVAQLLGVLTAHPALFQIDPSEWTTQPPYDCKFVTADTLVTMQRRSLAGRPVGKDTFGYWLKRVDGVVQLTALTGTYLPVVGAATGDTMAACNTLTQATATSVARNTQLQAGVYSACRRTGTVTYTPRADDTFQFTGPETWSWEDTGHVVLTGQRILRVTVNPTNYTSQLTSSDARCPTADGNGFTVGFDITFDVHTGAIVYIKPGLDCVVC